jgi:hypothetical protein
VGSNPTGGMDVCVHSVSAFLCIVRELTSGCVRLEVFTAVTMKNDDEE